MTTEDRPLFAQAMVRMVRAFRVRLNRDHLEELTETYFKILEGASLADVLAAGKTCIKTRRAFPKAADWLQALPTSAASEAPDVRVMGTGEIAEYHQAERQHWTGDPCDCLLCQAACVTENPVRFVPDFRDDSRPDRAFDTVRNRVLVVGHWAHGEELVRWYAARAAFFACVSRLSPMARALAVLVPALVGEREPGQEG